MAPTYGNLKLAKLPLRIPRGLDTLSRRRETGLATQALLHGGAVVRTVDRSHLLLLLARPGGRVGARLRPRRVLRLPLQRGVLHPHPQRAEPILAGPQPHPAADGRSHLLGDAARS